MAAFVDLLANLILPLTLILTVTLGLGMTLTPRHFTELLSAPKALITGVLGQFILLPAAAILIALTLPLGPVIAAGLCIICFCPGGAMSNAVVFTVRGNSALSVSMTVCASLLMMVTLPFVLPPVVQLVTGSAVEGVSTLSVLRTLIVGIALPVTVGMLLRRYRPGFEDRAVEFIRPLSVLLLAAVVILSFYAARDFLTREATTIFGAATLLSAISVYGGYLWARWNNISLTDALTIAIEVGVQNIPFALFLATTVLGRPDLSIVIISYGVMNFLVMLTLIGLTHAKRRDSLANDLTPAE